MPHPWLTTIYETIPFVYSGSSFHRDDTRNKYFWGRAIVTSQRNVALCRGKPHRRYVLRRVDEEGVPVFGQDDGDDEPTEYLMDHRGNYDMSLDAGKARVMMNKNGGGAAEEGEGEEGKEKAGEGEKGSKGVESESKESKRVENGNKESKGVESENKESKGAENGNKESKDKPIKMEEEEDGKERESEVRREKRPSSKGSPPASHIPLPSNSKKRGRKKKDEGSPVVERSAHPLPPPPLPPCTASPSVSLPYLPFLPLALRPRSSPPSSPPSPSKLAEDVYVWPESDDDQCNMSTSSDILSNKENLDPCISSSVSSSDTSSTSSSNTSTSSAASVPPSSLPHASASKIVYPSSSSDRPSYYSHSSSHPSSYPASHPSSYLLPPSSSHASPPKKRMRAENTQYGGYHFKSRLEARTAVFLDTLGVEWQYESVTISYADRAKTYTCDFFLPDLSSGLFLEIKPSYPSDEEVLKAEHLCVQQRRDVAIVYNTSFLLPFKRARVVESYDAPPLRALLFRYEKNTKKTSWTDACVWKERDGVFFLEPRRSVDDLEWKTDVLVRAYAAARDL